MTFVQSMRFALLVFLFVSCCLASCSREPSHAFSIDPDTLAVIYANYLIVVQENQLMAVDSARAAERVDSLYSQHDIDAEKVRIALDEQRSDLDTWRTFNEKVVRRLEWLQQRQPTSGP
jgi:hypothetical protein